MPLQDSFRALPPDQKLAIVTAIGDDLASSAPLTLPPDELAETQRRRDEMLADPSIYGLRHAASARSDWFDRIMPTTDGQPLHGLLGQPV